jgi:hypothetical protein
MDPQQQFMEQFQAMQSTIRAQQNQLELLSNQLFQQNQSISARTPVVNIREPKVASPEFFTGNRKKSRAFLLQLKNVFRGQPECFQSSSVKVTYAISFLRDLAFDWISPFLENDHAILESFEEFEEKFSVSLW